MRKLFCSALVVALLFLGSFNLRAQVYNGDLTLTTQAQVDAFNYTSVTGKLTIINSSISNLNGLSELQSVGGVFEITNTAITNVDALTNLQSINFLFIRGNSSLTNLNGFSSLTTVPAGFRFENNQALVNFDGLLSVTGVVAGIYISTCPMTNLDGFSGISDITGFIELEGNRFLTNVDGLQGLQGADVVNSIKIIDNPLLQNINGLLSIKDAGGITITGNQILPNLDGLANLNTVAGMIISQNSALSNIDGLSNIQTMVDGLWIRSNFSLAHINGLGSLTIVGKELIIDVNPGLTNIDGLANLTTIGTNLIIASNSHLVNLNGLLNLTAIGNDLKVTSNQALVDFCGLFKLFDEGTIGGIVEIKNNGANTVSIAPPPDIILNNDPGLCSRDISSVVPTVATVTGCLNPGPSSATPYPPGNIFPVGTTNITWSVTDGAGNSATAIQKVIITDNEVPVITQFPADATVQCAADVPAVNINSVTATDNCPNVVVTHVGDVITNQTCANRYTLTRTFKATDGSGNIATRSQVITVNDNTPPQITGLSTSKQILVPPNHKMQDITVDYNVIDNCNSTPSYTISITSNEPENGTGDGDTDSDWEIIDVHHIRLRAERAATGTGRVYTITITANDGCNTPVSASTQVVVAHNITGPHSGNSFKAGSTVTLSGEFWDRPGNKHTAKWLIDGATVKGIVTEPSGNKNGKVTGSYKFTAPGVYKLQMNITDQTGLTTYTNTAGDLEAIVVIFDPNGGYAYGGGYFNSPAGALSSNPSAIGKASYGFAMNYFKNSTYPKGETQFEFKVGTFEFNALNFDYLAISNSMAQFKGTGKIIGGQSGIGFTMTVTDSDLDGSGVDKIRMKIYNKTNNAVIYDNQPGASDAALPSQAVGANSEIVIQGNSNIPQGRVTTGITTEPQIMIAGFDAKVFPNPSTNHFNIVINSNNRNELLMLQVYDVTGKLVETKNNLNAGTVIEVGAAYKPGIYLVRILQGKNHKEVKLVKFSY